jgi:ArsR family transcriptional regulator, arsenate/arsenite/antimonite-responsive transcriptional repressor / arsenate reductase (thioredoxin)
MTRHTEQPAQLLSLLADSTGWKIVTKLAHSDESQHSLASATGGPLEEVQRHLAVLQEMTLVSERPSDANPDETFYRLELTALRDALNAVGRAIHPVVGGIDAVTPDTLPPSKPRVLFLCTGNSARSQMAEGMLRYYGQGKVEVFSAGTQPSTVHPQAVKTMDRMGIDIHQQRSKHLDEFQNQQFDHIITVCDRQREVCPVFPGNPDAIHWSFPDPAAVEPADVQEHVFRSIANQLRNLTRYFLIALQRKEQI